MSSDYSHGDSKITPDGEPPTSKQLKLGEEGEEGNEDDDAMAWNSTLPFNPGQNFVFLGEIFPRKWFVSEASFQY